LRKRALVPFGGPLRHPIEWKGSPKVPEPTASEDYKEDFQAALEEFRSAQRQKLELLRKHYKLANGPLGDFDLAMRLAIEFVPGFKMANPLQSRGRNPQRPGRQRIKWTDGQYIGLLFDLERAKEEHGTNTDIEALKKIVSRPNDYFTEKPPRTEDALAKRAVSLNARLTEARKLVESKDLGFLFKPEHRSLLRQVFAPGSPERKNSFY
jgi:hypothetical protein